MKLSRERYHLLFNLLLNQGWLAKKQEKIFELLDRCETSDEQDLVVELLNRFSYLSASKFSDHLDSIADLICNGWGLDKSKTQLVATTVDTDPDSGQLLLQALKARLPPRGWADVKMNNLFGKSIAQIPDRPIIVLIDEFAGTGQTLFSRIKTLRNEAAAWSKKLGRIINIEVYVALVASMSGVRALIGPVCKQIESQMWLQKGISDYLVGQALQDAIHGMLRLESTLKQDIGRRAFPSLGDGGAEALYSLEIGNTPNSVFPIFWWRVNADGTSRNPVLDRQDPIFQ